MIRSSVCSNRLDCKSLRTATSWPLTSSPLSINLDGAAAAAAPAADVDFAVGAVDAGVTVTSMNCGNSSLWSKRARRERIDFVDDAANDPHDDRLIIDDIWSPQIPTDYSCISLGR